VFCILCFAFKFLYESISDNYRDLLPLYLILLSYSVLFF